MPEFSIFPDNISCDPVLMKSCHICRWVLAVFNLLGVPDGRGLQHQNNSHSVRQVHDDRKIYSNFQRLACYCLNFIGTYSVVQYGKPHSSGTPSKPKQTSNIAKCCLSQVCCIYSHKGNNRLKVNTYTDFTVPIHCQQLRTHAHEIMQKPQTNVCAIMQNTHIY